MIMHVLDSIMVIYIYRLEVAVIAMLVMCGTDIARVLGRDTRTRVSRGECMVVKVRRGWHGREAFVQDALSHIRSMLDVQVKFTHARSSFMR